MELELSWKHCLQMLPEDTLRVIRTARRGPVILKTQNTDMKLSLRQAPRRKSHPSSYKFTLADNLIVFCRGVNEILIPCDKHISYPASIAWGKSGPKN